LEGKGKNLGDIPAFLSQTKGRIVQVGRVIRPFRPFNRCLLPKTKQRLSKKPLFFITPTTWIIPFYPAHVALFSHTAQMNMDFWPWPTPFGIHLTRVEK
jgi:hypothetical protein